MRLILLLMLMSICAGCCETCGHSTHGHRPASSSGSVDIQPLQRVSTGLLAMKHSVQGQEAAVSEGDLEALLDDMDWMLRATRLSKSDIDSIAAVKQPKFVRQFMLQVEQAQALYASNRFGSFRKGAHSAVRIRIDAVIQQLRDMSLGEWSKRILQST